MTSRGQAIKDWCTRLLQQCSLRGADSQDQKAEDNRECNVAETSSKVSDDSRRRKTISTDRNIHLEIPCTERFEPLWEHEVIDLTSDDIDESRSSEESQNRRESRCQVPDSPCPNETERPARDAKPVSNRKRSWSISTGYDIRSEIGHDHLSDEVETIIKRHRQSQPPAHDDAEEKVVFVKRDFDYGIMKRMELEFASSTDSEDEGYPRARDTDAC